MLGNKRKFKGDSIESSRHVKPFVAQDALAQASPSPPSNLRTLTGLKDLLDLSCLTAQEDIRARFSAIAEVLLNDVVLRLESRGSDAGTSTDYEILELEFYLYKSGCHEDPFTHGTEEQRDSGKWYAFESRYQRQTFLRAALNKGISIVRRAAMGTLNQRQPRVVRPPLQVAIVGAHEKGLT